MDNNSFLGTSLTFPFEINSLGEVAKSSYEDNIAESIYIILMTKPGERLMLKEFGSHIHELIFSPNDVTTRQLMIVYVKNALEKWEKRIDVKKIEIYPTNDTTLNIEISYKIIETNVLDNRVYPFYLSK